MTNLEMYLEEAKSYESEMTTWEKDFVTSINGKKLLSGKQYKTLREIVKKYDDAKAEKEARKWHAERNQRILANANAVVEELKNL